MDPRNAAGSRPVAAAVRGTAAGSTAAGSPARSRCSQARTVGRAAAGGAGGHRRRCCCRSWWCQWRCRWCSTSSWWWWCDEASCFHSSGESGPLATGCSSSVGPFLLLLRAARPAACAACAASARESCWLRAVGASLRIVSGNPKNVRRGRAKVPNTGEKYLLKCERSVIEVNSRVYGLEVR